jgi:hypothetical protein
LEGNRPIVEEDGFSNRAADERRQEPTVCHVDEVDTTRRCSPNAEHGLQRKETTIG